jgi:mono/diheme cytochrome c family protein
MDPLVVKTPEVTPPPNGVGGRLDEELAELDSRGGKTLQPVNIPAESRLELDQFLRDCFGTPATPLILPPVNSPDGDGTTLVERLGLSRDSLLEGGKLFRKHCQGCHGLPGDGRGPAGLFINPYPRDFRRGAFKFISTGQGMKPCRADLLRTLSEGLKGTPMPSFGLLSEQERELLAGYATYLSIRGQVEFQTLVELDSRSGVGTVADLARLHFRNALAEWEKAEAATPPPSEPEDGEPGTQEHLAAVRRGFELFTAKTGTECLKCHGDFGRKPLLRYDIWGTIARPADFTATTLKGGVRPRDVFARVRGGIAAVGMPAHPALHDRQVWDLVRFVRSVPYPRELPEDVRAVVYPTP